MRLSKLSDEVIEAGYVAVRSRDVDAVVEWHQRHMPTSPALLRSAFGSCFLAGDIRRAEWLYEATAKAYDPVWMVAIGVGRFALFVAVTTGVIGGDWVVAVVMPSDASDDEFTELVRKAVTALDDAREDSRLRFIERNRSLALPRGMVAVETDGQVELWFTNEVKPPESATLGQVEIISDVHYLSGRTWDQVERWRFRP